MLQSKYTNFSFEGRTYANTREFARAFGLPSRLVWLRLHHGITDERLPINGNIHFRPVVKGSRKPKKSQVRRTPMYVLTSFGTWKV